MTPGGARHGTVARPRADRIRRRRRSPRPRVARAVSAQPPVRYLASVQRPAKSPTAIGAILDSVTESRLSRPLVVAEPTSVEPPVGVAGRPWRTRAS